MTFSSRKNVITDIKADNTDPHARSPIVTSNCQSLSVARFVIS